MSQTQKQRDEVVMQKTAEALNEIFAGNGFVLLTFRKGQPTNTNYVSNCRRKEMITALFETAKRLETDKEVRSVSDGNKN